MGLRVADDDHACAAPPMSSSAAAAAAATVVDGWFADAPVSPKRDVLSPGGAVERVDGGVEADERGAEHEGAGQRDEPPLPGRAPPAAELAAPHRHLDEPVAQLGHHGGDGERRDHPAHRTVVGVGEHEDRPVPEVDPVAALADLDERRPREHRPEPSRSGMDGDEHGDEREQRDEGEQPLVHVAVGERRHGGDAAEHGDGEHADAVEEPAAARAGRARRPPRPPDERRSGTEHQARGPRHRRQVHEVDAVDAVEAAPAASADRRVRCRGPRTSTASPPPRSPTSRPAVPARDSRLRRRATNASGHNRYHCSSTARLHTWRSSGGSPL